MLKCPNCETYNPLVEPYECETCGLGVRRKTVRELSGRLIDKKSLALRDLRYLKRELTLRTSPYKGAPQVVRCYDEDEETIWIPRHFDDGMIDLPPRPIGPENDVVSLDFKWTLDPERGQPEAKEAMVNHLALNTGGVLVAFTGCGKTALGYAIAAEFGAAIGILVYAEHMIEAWVSHAKDCLGLTDDDIGFVQEDRCDLGKPVTIIMVQSLYSTREYPKELYDQIGFIIADEVHRHGAPVWQAVLKKFSARYRLGLSADPRRSDGLGAIVDWNFGEIGHTIKKAESLANPKVVQIRYETFYKAGAYSSWSAGMPGRPDLIKYRKCLSLDTGRDIMIVRELVNARKKKRKILVFAHHRLHLLRMKDLFDAAIKKEGFETKTALYIARSKGKKEPADMKARIAPLAETLEADVVFSTYNMVGTAFNKPDLDTAVMVTPIGNILQALGRLRDKGPEDRQPLLLVDVYETIEYSEDRADIRQDSFQDLRCEVVRINKTNVEP
tara:strand:+ start:211 stop:1707 length:1497 start_codon:yes stop_codon:yes gene_type:complete